MEQNNDTIIKARTPIMIDPITKYILEVYDVSPPEAFKGVDFLKMINDLENKLGIPLTTNITDTWYTRKGYKAIGIGIVVGLISLLSYKVYKKYISKAARACKQFKGDQKNTCMEKHRGEAKKARIMALEKSKSLCAKSKDPKLCVAKIKHKIRKLKQ